MGLLVLMPTLAVSSAVRTDFLTAGLVGIARIAIDKRRVISELALVYGYQTAPGSRAAYALLTQRWLIASVAAAFVLVSADRLKKSGSGVSHWCLE